MDEDQIEFMDNKGNKMKLSANLTIKQLVEMGIQDIQIVKPEEPLPDGWIRSIH